MSQLKHDGVQLRTKDDRDHLGGTLFDLPKIESLPKTFILSGDFKVKNQGALDFCSAYASCLASQFQEKTELEPSFSFMMSKVLTGDKEVWGQQLRDIARSHVKYGALDINDCPISMLVNTERDEIVDVVNWGDIKKLLDKAIKHKKQSFFWVTGNYDHFDNIKATLWKFKDEDRAIVFGTLWDNEWLFDTRIIQNVAKSGFGHALCIVGFTEENGEEYLIVQNSWGDNSIGGRHLFSREVINQAVDRYGAFMFSDISAEEQKWYNEHGVKIEQSFIGEIIIAIWKSIEKLLKQLQYAIKNN